MGPKLDLTWLRLALFSLLAAAAFLAVAVWLLDLVPPKRLSFAAGRSGGAYFALAERYAEILERDGIVLEIIDTAGSVENATLLADGRADAGFLQGGVSVPEGVRIDGLAAVFLEPLWVLHRGPPGPADPSDWQGLRIAAGEPGGGTRYAVDAVAEALGIGGLDLVDLGGREAALALAAGEVDIGLFVAPASAPYLQPLILDPELTLASIRDAEALVRSLPFVERADIPAAAFDYARRLPPARVELVAMIGRLVARADLHPSLVDRLVMAAREVHSGRDLLADENRFPSTEGLAMPVNAQAAALLDDEPSRLRELLPYWMVAQINSFALLLVPVLFLLVPLVRTVPSLYSWQMQAKVFRRYADLLRIEAAAPGARGDEDLDRLERQLDRIESDVVRLRLPARFRENAYTMRVHIDLVRRRIAERRRDLAPKPR